jgi:hypothetical protein
LKLRRCCRAIAILREAQRRFIFRRDARKPAASNIAEFNGGRNSPLKNARAAGLIFIIASFPADADRRYISDCAEMHRPF